MTMTAKETSKLKSQTVKEMRNTALTTSKEDINSLKDDIIALNELLDTLAILSAYNAKNGAIINEAFKKKFKNQTN